MRVTANHGTTRLSIGTSMSHRANSAFTQRYYQQIPLTRTFRPSKRRSLECDAITPNVGRKRRMGAHAPRTSLNPVAKSSTVSSTTRPWSPAQNVALEMA